MRLYITSGAMSILTRIKSEWKHAFAIARADGEWDEADRELVARMADIVVRRGLSAPISMALESVRPLNFIGSQVLAFLTPFATLVFSREQYERFVLLMERRESVDLLIDAIAKRESETELNG
jgi:hypothetical protein